MLDEIQDTVAVNKSKKIRFEQRSLEEMMSGDKGIRVGFLPVAPFVVVPRDKLHEGSAQAYASLGIEDT